MRRYLILKVLAKTKIFNIKNKDFLKKIIFKFKNDRCVSQKKNYC